MRNVKPKSLEFIERLEKGEKLPCPSCKTGLWEMKVSKNGRAIKFECNNCGKSIIPRMSTTATA